MLRERGRQFHNGLIILDIAIVVGVYGLLLTLPEMQLPGVAGNLGRITLLCLGVIIALAWPLILTRLGAYQSQRRQRIGETVTQLFSANGAGALLVSALVGLMDAPLAASFPLLLGAGILTAQAAVRLPVFLALQLARRFGANYRNVLVIGAGPRAARVESTIDDRAHWGMRVIGFVDDCESADGAFTPAVDPERVHKFIELPNLLRENIIDEVLVACPRTMLDVIAPLVAECSLVGVPVSVLTDLFGPDLPAPRMGRFDTHATISFAPVHHSEVELTIKRTIDVLGATLGLVASVPLIVGAAIGIRLTSGAGPIFFRQMRCGLNGRRFTMYKLRTMVPDAEEQKAELMHLNEMDGPVFKMKDDPRVTPIGRWLRKLSLDELPQFWNVLKGDMSLVGPRPPTPDEVIHYKGGERRRLSMRPGLTCLWQISGRNEVSFDEWMELDLDYIDNWSVTRDLEILLRTIPQILVGRGAR